MNKRDKITPAETTVVLLAAGFGKRMQPLTNTVPKPLLKVGSTSLIEHHLNRLKAEGFNNIVVNVSHLGEKIIAALGDGSHYGLKIQYSNEIESGPLETAGGLQNALPLIKSDPFLVINADIWTDFCFAEMLSPLHVKGRLLMVANPDHNPLGDFSIDHNGTLNTSADARLTFSGVALYRRSLFSEMSSGKQALAPIFRSLISEQQLQGQLFTGVWSDVGTPDRLEQLNQCHKISH